MTRVITDKMDFIYDHGKMTRNVYAVFISLTHVKNEQNNVTKNQSPMSTFPIGIMITECQSLVVYYQNK